HPRVIRVHRQVGGAGALVAVQHQLPILAAVGRAVNAARRVRAIDVPEGGHVDGLGILRVDSHAGDVARVLQAQVGPGVAAVVGAVDAIPGDDVAADAGLAHPDVDDVAVG